MANFLRGFQKVFLFHLLIMEVYLLLERDHGFKSTISKSRGGFMADLG